MENPPARMVGESLSTVFVDREALETELLKLYELFAETIRVQWGLVAAGAYYNCGVIDLKLKRYDLARRNFEEAIKLDPNDNLAKHNLKYAKKMVLGEATMILPILKFHNTQRIYEKINENSRPRSMGVK